MRKTNSFGKKLKKFLLLSGTIAGVTAINKKIFENAITQRDEDNFYNWKHGQIRYKKMGSGKPLLLIHDTLTGSGIHEWDNTFKYLARTNTVYAIDLLGYSFSDKPNITYSGYLYITLINDFINNVIQQPTGLVTNGTSSLFGVMAHSFNRDNITELLMISPKHIGIKNQYPTEISKVKRFVYELPVIGTSFHNILNSRILNTMWKKSVFENPNAVSKETFDEAYYASHSQGARSKYSNAAYLSDYLYSDVKDRLSNIDIPVTVVWGINDELNPIDNFKIIEYLNNDIELVMFKKTKSMPHLENPKTFARVCDEFFN